MKCEKFEQRLHQLWDDRQSPQDDEQLQSHASQCAECHQFLSSAIAVQDGLDATEFPPTSKSFSQDVVGQTLAIVEKERTSTRRFSVVSLLAIVAALILVAVIPALQSTNDESQALPSHTVASIEDVSDSEKPIANEPVDQNAINEVESKDLADIFSSSFTIPEIEVSRLAEVSGQIDSDKIPGVRPITSSFSTAIDLMRTALPGQKSSNSEKPQARLFKTDASQIS